MASILSLTALSPGYAQQEYGTPVGGASAEKLDDGQTRILARDFARCVVKKNHDLAARYVLDRTTLGFPDRYGKLVDGDCLLRSSAVSAFDSQVQLGMSGDALRFALADALIQAEKQTITAEHVSTAEALAPMELDPANYQPKDADKGDPDEAARLERDFKKDRARLRIRNYGECVARRDARGAERLVDSDTNSAEEMQAIQALMPDLSACLDKGVQIDFSKTMLRGTIAFAYYSLAHQPRMQASPDAPKQ